MLRAAEAGGATLERISRGRYRLKNTPAFLAELRNRLADRYGVPETSIWVIPEGGTTAEGVNSAGEVYHEIEGQLGGAPDYVCISAGTGGTAAGLLQAIPSTARVEVYPALKGNWMAAEIARWLPVNRDFNYECITDYHFGGYGKFPANWLTPTTGLAKRADIGEPGLPPLEPIYTAKLFHGVLDRLHEGVYPSGARLVVIHTGGIY